MKYVTSRGIDCTLITNAALITPAMARSLREAGLGRIQVSLHHFVPEVSDEITGANDSLCRTLRGTIALLKEFSPDTVNINMVAHRRTAGDVYRMGCFLRPYGIMSFTVGVMSCSGLAKANDLTISIANLQSILAQLAELRSGFGMNVGLTGGVPFCAIPRDIEAEVHVNNTCDAAIHQIVIGPNGDCRPCVELPFVGGNIYRDSIEDIWMSSPFEQVRMFHNVPTDCRSCRFVSSCHGGCRASAYNFTGSICGKDFLMPSEIPSGFLLANT